MMSISRILRFLVALGLTAISASALNASDDMGVWQTVEVDMFESGRFSTGANAEFRFLDGDELQHWEVSQKFNYKLTKNWTAGLHPLYEEDRQDDGTWRHGWRINTEISSSHSLPGGFKLKTRNRLEFRQREHSGGDWTNRLRQRTLISHPASFFPGLREISFGNEIFYDMEDDEFSANRLYPLRLSFDITEQVGVTVYYLYESKRRPGSDWDGAHILGVSTSLGF